MADFKFDIWMQQAVESLEKLKESLNESEEVMTDRLCEYIQCRYLLKKKPEKKDVIDTLAEESVAEIAKMSSEQLSAMEDMSGCTGAKSAMVKKILLIMTLNEQFQLGVEEDIRQIKTIEDIVKLLKENKRQGEGKC